MEECTGEIERNIDNSQLYQKVSKVSEKLSDKDLSEVVERSKIIFDYLSDLERCNMLIGPNKEFYIENCTIYKARCDVSAKRYFQNMIRGNN